MVHLFLDRDDVHVHKKAFEQTTALGLDEKKSCCAATAIRLETRHLKALLRLLRTQESALAPARLTVTQFTILSKVEAQDSEPFDLKKLAATLLLDGSILRRDLRILERDRYVRRIVADEDIRSGRWVELTATGLAKLQFAQPLWEQAHAEFEAALGEPAATALRSLLALFTSLDVADTLDFKTPVS